MIDDKAGTGTGRLLYVLPFQIIHFDAAGLSSLGIVGGKTCGFLKGPVRNLLEGGPFCFQNDVRAGNVIGVEQMSVGFATWKVSSSF